MITTTLNTCRDTCNRRTHTHARSNRMHSDNQPSLGDSNAPCNANGHTRWIAAHTHACLPKPRTQSHAHQHNARGKQLRPPHLQRQVRKLHQPRHITVRSHHQECRQQQYHTCCSAPLLVAAHQQPFRPTAWIGQAKKATSPPGTAHKQPQTSPAMRRQPVI